MTAGFVARASASLFAAVLLCSAALGADASTEEPDVIYQVNRGDTLYSLAGRWLVSHEALYQVARYNRIRNPHQILTAHSLRFPFRLLKTVDTTARVETFSGEVSIIAGGVSASLTMDQAVPEGATIATGRNSFVTLRLADGSGVSVPSQSVVRIDRLRRIVINGALLRQFSVIKGRVRTKVTPMKDPGSSFRVLTPSTVSAVRGTSFRISYDPEAFRSGTEVEEGKVGTAGQKAASGELTVPAGFGASTVKEQSSGLVKLLPPPKLIDPERVQSEEDLRFALVPVDAADRYHLQIARDAGFLDPIAEDLASQPAFTFPTLPAGTYFARASAVDVQQLEGLTQTYAFDRYRNLVSASMGQSGAGRERRYQFQWGGTADGKPTYRFRLWPKAAPDKPVVDEMGLSIRSLTVANLPADEYVWRVGSFLFVNGKVVETWTADQSFVIAKAR